MTCQLNMPVAPGSADECAVVAAVSGKLAKLLKTQDVNVKAESCRNLTHWSGNSHRRGRERSSAHAPTAEVYSRAHTPAPVMRDAQTRRLGLRTESADSGLRDTGAVRIVSQ